MGSYVEARKAIIYVFLTYIYNLAMVRCGIALVHSWELGIGRLTHVLMQLYGLLINVEFIYFSIGI
jgi:hypothetical protein